ncbi:non-canonical purine NTP diphosphatase [bacterium SCSIO 12741]|nr:non-canonical purine NTP diphosphatase [bacterium SCSIO 12741]
MNLVFTTNNANKLKEVQNLVGSRFTIQSLQEIGFSGDIPETQNTLEGNASQKSHYIKDRYEVNCFADDTGLEVDALNGEPGVYSARYAGENCSYEDNCNKLLREMDGKENRTARFRTVISLLLNGNEYYFEGIVEGQIIEEKRGDEGFGYDPLFIPKGFDRTFSEMSLEEKNQISHRARATQKLVDFLQQLD